VLLDSSKKAAEARAEWGVQGLFIPHLDGLTSERQEEKRELGLERDCRVCRKLQ
jgi:hypothetical protein